jgi:hypothetical protein
MSTETLEITKSNVIAAFKSATAEGKALLTNLFGTKNLYEKITDRIQTFADVEEISGKKLIRRSDETDDEFAYRQIKLIAEVYNEGTVLDPMNTKQYKYYPWHEITPGSGVGLSFFDTYYWLTFTFVGSRLCFKSAELAADAGKKFIEIYSQLKIK